MTNYKDSDKRLAKTKFAKSGGSCFECCDYESMYSELKSFLHQELDRARKEIRKEIEGMKKNTDFKYWSYEKINGFLIACDQILDLLDKQIKD
jgi:hypothetical protein